MWVRLRLSFRLRVRRAALECILPVTVHRFDETINGREYHIEVSPVGSNKWRAQIARPLEPPTGTSWRRPATRIGN